MWPWIAGGQSGSVAARGDILVSGDVVLSSIEAFERSNGDLADRLVSYSN